jgi:IPT/TIG domain
VRFGSAAASSMAVGSESEITATCPAGSGTVDVTVTAPGGTSAASSAAQFTYCPVPVISTLDDDGGPEAGNVYVSISGSGFTDATAVRFGSAEATGLTVNSDTQITVISPAGSGTVYVTVTTPGGTSADTEESQYIYFPAPEVTGIEPDSGPETGGTIVGITGSNFSPPNDVIVWFRTSNAETQAAHTVESETEISATTPASSVSGTATVIVSTPGGTASTEFSYTDDAPYDDSYDDAPYDDSYDDAPYDDSYDDAPYDDSDAANATRRPGR